MKRTISVLLVDDHNLVRRGFRKILEDDPRIAIAGEAEDGATAVRLAAELRPTVVVMDYALPGMTGIAATKKILEANPEARVLVLSMHSEEICVRQALEAGALGYLLKNAMDLELVGAVKRIAAGERVLDGSLTLPEKSKDRLTQREIEVLQLIAEGQSNKQIAAQLGLSVNTIAVHRANIMDELDIHKTAELVAYAIRNKLVNLP